jgi:hypothetical protein
MFPKFRGIRQEKNEPGDMNEDLRSILTGTAVLTVGAVVSLVLTILGVLGVLLWVRLLEFTRQSTR